MTTTRSCVRGGWRQDTLTFDEPSNTTDSPSRRTPRAASTPSRDLQTRYLSPLRYPGGKARMAPWLVDIFYAQNAGPLDVEIWIEPFAGGAGAALHALIEYDVPEAWLIESNPALAAYWRTTTGPDAHYLADRVDSFTPTVAAFRAAQDLLTAVLTGDASDADDLEVAWAAFLVNRCSRSGMITSRVGVLGGNTQGGRDGVAARFNGPALAARIRRIAALGRRIRTFSADGISYIEDLAGSGIEDEAFLFVDPPYIAQGTRLYAHGSIDHDRLAAALHACPTPWLLTYDAHPRVLELYPEQPILQFRAPHTTGRRRRTADEYAVLSTHLGLPGPHLPHPLGDPGDEQHSWAGTGEWDVTAGSLHETSAAATGAALLKGEGL